jgi:hypothetical protein
MVNVALALPAASGLKVIVKGALCPAGIVTGKESPLTVKAELLVVAAVTVTLAPVANKLPDAVPLSLTVTLPRFSVVGLTDNCPACGDAPVPESGIVSAGFGAFEVTVTFPLTAPAA